jgi:hypothetical protein
MRSERTAEIEIQKEALAYSNKEIVSSIKYAERIQQAILPALDGVKKVLPNSFFYYKPKDVVSGDFYFDNNEELENFRKELQMLYENYCGEVTIETFEEYADRFN